MNPHNTTTTNDQPREMTADERIDLYKRQLLRAKLSKLTARQDELIAKLAEAKKTKAATKRLFVGLGQAVYQSIKLREQLDALVTRRDAVESTTSIALTA